MRVAGITHNTSSRSEDLTLGGHVVTSARTNENRVPGVLVFCARSDFVLTWFDFFHFACRVW